MSATVTATISFLELAKLVLQEAVTPMTTGEIWQKAQQMGLDTRLNSTGLTKGASLSARLYTDVQKPNSLFRKVGSDPAKFELKTGSLPNLAPLNTAQSASPIKLTKYLEKDLHHFLVWFADWQFGIQCKTIIHTAGKTLGELKWIHPDIVGFALTTQDWKQEVVNLAQNARTFTARIYSFELKISLDFPTLREYFFQAVSNSSWAHEGYLVAADISDDQEFRKELSRLSQSFGIGVIHLDVDEPNDSTVILPARKNPEIDWPTVNRVAKANSDFAEFIGSVSNSVKINQLALNKFDKLLVDAEMDAHLKKITGKTP